jgi:UDP-glucose 4-epimerase
MIEFSSSEAYGTAETVPMNEDHPLRPCTPYAASKAASDFVVLSYIETFGIDAAVLRPFNNFAPRQNDAAYAGVIPIVINRVRRGEPIEIFGDGEQTRDFIYAPDTAVAAVELYRSPATRGVVVNVGSGRETSVNELVAAILEIMDVPDHPVVHVDERPGDVRRHCADISRARETFGFEPTTELFDGLRRTIEWYRGKNRP